MHIDLPKDIMTAVLQGAAVPLPMQPPPQAVDRKALDHVAHLLRVAKKPILYVGQGANDAVSELTQLAELCNIPVTTTLHAMGVFSEHHRLSMHMLGMHGAAYANYAIQASDLIIAVGSRFDDRTTGLLGKYAPVAKAAAAEGKGGFVHFDIEPSQIGRVLSATVAVPGDCKGALQMLLPMVDAGTASTPARQQWADHCAELKLKFPFSYTAPTDSKIKT